MIKSMTSYGRAREIIDGKDILIEIKSVNNRYFDCSIKISKLYGFLEEKIKSYIQTKGISRGKLDVYVNIDVVNDIGTKINLDESYTESYINVLYNLRDRYNLKDDITVMSIAQNRDIFTVTKPEENIEQNWIEVMSVLDKALEQFISMRENEGKNLKCDILLKKQKIEECISNIDSLASMSVESYKTKIEQRIRQIIADISIQIEDNRILTECAIFADKVAIDEELVRLKSHLDSFDKIFLDNEPIGRKLDFLLQEINRETNTIGSKSNSIEISKYVIEMKSELEKIREQIQNIE